MNKTLAVILALLVPFVSLGQFPSHSNSNTFTLGTTDFNDFSYTWSGLDNQDFDVTFPYAVTNGTVMLRVAKQKYGPTTLEVQGFLVVTNRATLTIYGTNVPPVQNYFAEWALVNTNATPTQYRSLAKGKVCVLYSLWKSTNFTQDVYAQAVRPMIDETRVSGGMLTVSGGVVGLTTADVQRVALAGTGGGISNVVVNGKAGVLSGSGSNVLSTITLVAADLSAVNNNAAGIAAANGVTNNGVTINGVPLGNGTNLTITYVAYANIASNVTAAVSNAFTLAGAKVSASTNADYATVANTASNMAWTGLSGTQPKLAAVTNADVATLATTVTGPQSNLIATALQTQTQQVYVAQAGTSAMATAVSSAQSNAFATATQGVLAASTYAWSTNWDNTWTNWLNTNGFVATTTWTNWLATNSYVKVEGDPVFATNGVTRAMTNGWTVSAHSAWLTAEADTLQSAADRGGAVTNKAVTFDAANAVGTNTYGGMVSVLGKHIRDSTSSFGFDGSPDLAIALYGSHAHDHSVALMDSTVNGGGSWGMNYATVSGAVSWGFGGATVSGNGSWGFDYCYASNSSCWVWGGALSGTYGSHGDYTWNWGATNGLYAMWVGETCLGNIIVTNGGSASTLSGCPSGAVSNTPAGIAAAGGVTNNQTGVTLSGSFTVTGGNVLTNAEAFDAAGTAAAITNGAASGANASGTVFANGIATNIGGAVVYSAAGLGVTLARASRWQDFSVYLTNSWTVSITAMTAGQQWDIAVAHSTSNQIITWPAGIKPQTTGLALSDTNTTGYTDWYSLVCLGTNATAGTLTTNLFKLTGINQ